MTEFLTQITSISWWLGVVIVGVLINLASAYAKPKFDTIIGNISKNVRNKNEKKRKAWEENVKRLSEDDSYRSDYSNKISYEYLKSIHLMLMGIVMFLFALTLGKIDPVTEASIISEKYMALIKFLLCLIGSLAALLSMSRDKLANKMIRMLTEANRIIGNDYR